MATVGDQQREIEALRARVAELERELAEQAARANAAIAAAQQRAYWLDRWHVDLNAVMEKPGASQFRAILRAIRAVYRPVVKLLRPLRRR
jgi:cell division septum initiation protein DivIVA